MLTPYSEPQFVEKTITSHTGEQFRVVFLVAIVNGEVRARVISAVSMGSARAHTLSLPVPFIPSPSVISYAPAFAPKVSPYFTLEFFISQPTRAPSL